MRSFTISAAVAVFLSALSSSVGNTSGLLVHASKDLEVTAVNPLLINDRRGRIEFGEKCTIPFESRIDKVVDDDRNLRVIASVDRPRKGLPAGHCPADTHFFLSKDDFFRMEYDYLVAFRNGVQQRLNYAMDEAKEMYRKMGMQDERLYVATLLDPVVMGAMSDLQRANEAVLDEKAAMDAEKKRQRELAMTN